MKICCGFFVLFMVYDVFAISSPKRCQSSTVSRAARTLLAEM